MAVSALEVRMARLEGAYEQISARLGGIEHRLESLEQRVTSEFAAVRTEVRAETTDLRKRLGLILVGVFFAGSTGFRVGRDPILRSESRSLS